MAGTPDAGEPGDGLVGQRVGGAGRGQHQGVELADPGGAERLAQPAVEDVEERGLEAEDPAGADLQAGVALGGLGDGSGTSTLAW